MPGPTLVSVIVPTYNRARFLGDAIASIRAQDDVDVEIVVIDDGSTDDTEVVAQAQRPPVVYRSFGHLGVSAARNHGLAAARGDLVAFLDSDDVWPSGSLAARRAYLDLHADVDLVYGRTMIREVGGQRHRRGSGDAERSTSAPLLGSLLCRRSVFERVGGFDESLAHAEDVEWLARVQAADVSMRAIDTIALEYRIHGQNMTGDVAANQAFLLRALKQSLDRRRS